MASQSRSDPRNRLPSPSPLLGAPHERGDVDDLERRVHELLRRRHLAEALDPLVGHLGDADGRLGGGERVRGDDRRRAGERVEQARLAAVGEADEAEAFHRLGAYAWAYRATRPATLHAGSVPERHVATEER